jgi:hypothetical protein
MISIAGIIVAVLVLSLLVLIFLGVCPSNIS